MNENTRKQNRNSNRNRKQGRNGKRNQQSKNFKNKDQKENDKKVPMKYEVKQAKTLETIELKYDVDGASEKVKLAIFRCSISLL